MDAFDALAQVSHGSNKGAEPDYGPPGPRYRENVQLRPAPHAHSDTPAAVKSAMV
jgi:hypothetical protein